MVSFFIFIFFSAEEGFEKCNTDTDDYAYRWT